MNKIKNLLLTTLIVSMGVSCSDFLNPSVDQQITTDKATSTPGDLVALVAGVHDRLNTVQLYGRDMLVSGDVMSDNAFSNANSGRFVTQGDFNLLTTNAFPTGVWNTSYSAIANANLVINSNVTMGNKSDSATVFYARGQAYGLRALNHFNLLMWFGQQYVTGAQDLGVPYIETYAEGNLYPSRNTISEVYTKLKADLTQAATLMQNAIALDATIDAGSSYLNYYALKGLQSRVLLAVGDYDAAIAAADVVINSGEFTLLDQNAFLAAWAAGSGPNSLFEVEFTDTDRLGTDNIARIYRETNYGDVEATKDLFDAYADTDVRKQLLEENPAGTYRMVNKYVDELGTDNVRIIRYAEVLLNKAEALAKKGGASAATALAIINNLSTVRGGGAPYTVGSVDNVLKERRLELAFEGFRLFDLARNGKAIPIKGSRNVLNATTQLNYGDYRYALPIPQDEINANSNMVQNKDHGI